VIWIGWSIVVYIVTSGDVKRGVYRLLCTFEQTMALVYVLLTSAQARLRLAPAKAPTARLKTITALPRLGIGA